MTNQTAELANLAALMNLSPVDAVALPTTITVAAKSLGMSESRLVWTLTTNEKARAYVASVCRTAMSA